MNLQILQNPFRIFLFVVFGFFSCTVFAQKKPQEPTLPREPKVSDFDPRGEKNGSRESQDSQKNKKTSRDTEVKIQAILCDGRKVTGTWLEKNKEITFHHIRDGIRYQKTIPTATIERVRIQSWKAELQKKEKEGTAFKMLPHSVMIQLKNGDTFQKDRGLEGTDYSILKITNENGSATVYSMWIDLLYKYGSWYSKLKPVKPSESRTDCHKDVLREIVFQ